MGKLVRALLKVPETASHRPTAGFAYVVEHEQGRALLPHLRAETRGTPEAGYTSHVRVTCTRDDPPAKPWSPCCRPAQTLLCRCCFLNAFVSSVHQVQGMRLAFASGRLQRQNKVISTEEMQVIIQSAVEPCDWELGAPAAQ